MQMFGSFRLNQVTITFDDRSADSITNMGHLINLHRTNRPGSLTWLSAFQPTQAFRCVADQLALWRRARRCDARA
jgi:hypothetical protein